MMKAFNRKRRGCYRRKRGISGTSGNVPTGAYKKAKLIPVKTLATITLALAMGAGAMLWWRDTPPSGSCMYWAQDHYEPIPCGQKIPGARIIALDSIRLKNFRRITRPDTISYQSKGKVWYSKISGKVEFYTWGGEHPVVFDYRLKPVTKYIIDTYILSQVITSE
ncbi:hypothetical protein MKQ70_02680 [Chitinophaga sedimenti]|uniref:hypothetical protein n=1 Tax=Chitinophaga sedimenti TaxID=2033606 RepID=UPI002006AC8A|nr:hypothetical protein [Chitinophaga sedimenti]MCK7553970.1 hypothetical protein [Chitinophaga sedimenti]